VGSRFTLDRSCSFRLRECGHCTDVNAMLAFLPIVLVLLVPICLTIFSLRDRKRAS
jgi:hypothetical protein